MTSSRSSERRRGMFRNVVVALAALLGAWVATLWAWNTVAAPWGGPQLDAREAFAAIVLALVVRVLFGARVHDAGVRRSHPHEHT